MAPAERRASVIRTLLVFVLLCCVGSSAIAQVNLYPEPLGTLYLSSWPDEFREIYCSIAPLHAFDFYLVADIDFGDIGRAEENVSNGMLAWEAQITIPTEILLLAATLHPRTSINIGSIRNGVYDYFVGTGQRAPVGELYVLVAYEGFMSDPPAFGRAVATIAPMTENPSVPDATVWVESLPAGGCEVRGLPEPCIYRFAQTRNMRIFFSCPTGDVETFGSMKARFDEGS